MRRGNVDSCRLLELPVVRDERGSLTYVEEPQGLDFAVRRIYYLYDVPKGAGRGAHAHRELHQLVIAMAGRFDVALDDGRARRTVTLDRPSAGLRIGPMIWRDLRRFSPDAVCLVLASMPYGEADYIRDYGEFRRQADLP